MLLTDGWVRAIPGFRREGHCLFRNRDGRYRSQPAKTRAISASVRATAAAVTRAIRTSGGQCTAPTPTGGHSERGWQARWLVRNSGSV